MSALFIVLAGLVSYALGSFITRRIYRRKLAAAQAEAGQAWAEAKESAELMGRWKRLYYRLLDLGYVNAKPE